MQFIKKHILGIVGLTIGFMAIFVAINQDDMRKHFDPPKEDNRTFKELALESGKKLLKQKFLKEKPIEDEVKRNPIESSKLTDSVHYVYYGLGFLALVLGVLSYVKKENIRISVAAFSTGLIALAWTYVLYAVFIAVLFILLSGMA
ncbi:MAG: hypothetical protein HQL32_02680 [Planctomycetes bacterium]|nr:hypothetical protein [Planctomycetota bacterium]